MRKFRRMRRCLLPMTKETKMKSDLKNPGLFLLCVLAMFFLAACGGGGDGSSTTSSMGTLKTTLTDSSTEEYQAIYVTVERVEVKPESGDWETVATPGGTYDLLSLVNGVREELGISFLDSGHYNQMRLILGDTPDSGLNILGDPHPNNVEGNYLIDQSDAVHKLKVPSGFNTGIKIVHGFDISENQTTELILDFDAMKSVVKAGSSGKYLLKPTIKVLDTVDSAIVSGLVSDGTDGIEGALVSAQMFDNLALDAADEVTVERSTITAGDDSDTIDDETGEYSLYLPAGDYNLVAYRTGYEPVCHTVSPTVASSPTAQNFSLPAAVTGTVSGLVHISSADPISNPDPHVTIDFRQVVDCDGTNAMINVKTLEIGDEFTYSVDLPIGDYQVVALYIDETGTKTTLTYNISIAENPETTRNLFF